MLIHLCYVHLQWDPEVRDKALGLIEDFAKGLPLQAYKEAYEGLLVSMSCCGWGCWGFALRF